MSREGAETYLRLMAEAELRRMALHAGGGTGQRPARDLALIAYVLAAVGAIDTDVVRAELNFAILARRPAPASDMSPGPQGQPPTAEWRRARVLHVLAPRPVTGAFAVPGADHAASSHAPWRVVPAGRMTRVLDGDVRGELHLLAYAQTAAGARFTATGWLEGPPGVRGARTGPGGPPRPGHPGVLRVQCSAVDDQGTTYQLGFNRRRPVGRAQWRGVLELRPDPPRDIRWLDLSMTSGDAATRIDLDPQFPHRKSP